MAKKSITIRPESAVTIKTYKELRELVHNFAAGNITLLAIVGRPGLSKSQSLKEVIADSDCYFCKGRITPIKFYAGLYHYQDRPVLIDDADDLLGDKLSREYIKSLTETDQYKRLSWASRTSALAAEGVPEFFHTTSSCCIITNSWDSNDAIYSALESRAEFVYFEPDWGELYQECARWFWDQEIFDYVHQRLDVLKQPDARVLVKASQRKQAGMQALNWQKLIDSYCDDEAGLLLRDILADRSYPNNTRRCEEWMQKTGLDRRTFYYRMKNIRQYRPHKKVPRIQLNRTQKPKEERPADGVLIGGNDI